jgi:hypothetical protein
MADGRGAEDAKRKPMHVFLLLSGVALLAESQVFPMRRVQGQGVEEHRIRIRI